MKNKEWNVKSLGENEEKAAEIISKELGLSILTSRLLVGRGYADPESARRFIASDYVVFHDPFLLKDMDKAVERIIRAIENGEKIVIYGDYDVDGVTSVSILYLYIRKKGGNAGYYIPSRTGEGYGINPNAIASLAEDGAKLLITVDTGITAIEETELAKSYGLDVIITDHHECQENLPASYATVNPRRPDCGYPFKELAGVGVVFKLICSIEKTLSERDGAQKDWLDEMMRTYGDLVAIGTVADVMPLVDENRYIVSVGLGMVEKIKRPGLEALLEKSGVHAQKNGAPGKKITSTLISYGIAPRINAAGRISNATRAVELFLCEDQTSARKIAEELCETNRQRQAEENKIIEQAYKKIHEEHDFENDRVIVLSEDNWHNGAIGIVASRITEHYNLPSILISFDGNVSKGSGRSIKGLNLVDALSYCSDLLIKYGGHELAAGLSIDRENLPAFKKKINEYAREHLSPEDLITHINVDAAIEMRDVTLKNAEELSLLEPFGVANPMPVFTMNDAVIVDVIPIGSNKHTKYILKKDGKIATAVCFGRSYSENDLYEGDTADIVFNLETNEYLGQKSAQLTIRDIRPGRETLEKRSRGAEDYRSVKAGRKIGKKENVIPSREDFVNVYYAIQREMRQGNNTITVGLIERNQRGLGYTKIRFIIDILRETNVFRIVPDEEKDGVYKITANPIHEKINLEKSSILKRLRSLQE